MRRWKACVLALAWAAPRAAAEPSEGPLTLEGARQRAREHAAAVLTARGRVEEARVRVQGAGILRDHLVLEASVGDRSSLPIADLDFAVSQTFELGGRRGHRTAAAEAGLVRETALFDRSVADAVRDAGIAFHRAIAAGERVRLARAAAEFAAQIAHIAERRHAAGDATGFEVNLASAALARARSDARAAEAAETLARGELRIVIALEAEAPLTLSGDLRPVAEPTLEALLASASVRPEVRALAAEVREAEAEAALGGGQRWPELTPSLRYEREAGDRVWWGGVSVSLPFWNRGQEARALGETRIPRLRAGVGVQQRTLRTEVTSAFEAYRLRLAALQELEEAARHVEENETLARRSYEEGQIGLAELLLVRRETVEARLVHLERRLAVAEAEADLMARAGVVR